MKLNLSYPKSAEIGNEIQLLGLEITSEHVFLG